MAPLSRLAPQISVNQALLKVSGVLILVLDFPSLAPQLSLILRGKHSHSSFLWPGLEESRYLLTSLGPFACNLNKHGLRGTTSKYIGEGRRRQSHFLRALPSTCSSPGKIFSRLDLSRAFNTVDHSFLFKTFSLFGFKVQQAYGFLLSVDVLLLPLLLAHPLPSQYMWEILRDPSEILFSYCALSQELLNNFILTSNLLLTHRFISVAQS